MGYRDDGFFNINWSQDARNAGPSGSGKENASFIFPDGNIRFLEAQAEMQRRFNTGRDTIQRGDYRLHRGYIRNLEQPQFGSVPISKCNFQFNPQEIRQTVAMREDMYIPFLQTSQQLAQPVGAVINFSFDLLFDRSHELSKGQSGNTDPFTPDTLSQILAGNSPSSPLNVAREYDPYDVGVLADLRVLYGVIGQGFSSELIEYQVKRYRKQEAYRNSTSIDDSTDTEEEDSEDSEDSTDTTGSSPSQSTIDDAELRRILDNNYGNWGLLMPNPVRVMFSSLFMLDGFITGTNVDFLKFNTNMVPLMCRVTLNMSAMYIGFAKTNTFLTQTFSDAADALEEEKKANEALKSEILLALTKTANIFQISTSWNVPQHQDNSWDDSIRNRSFPLDVWALCVNDNSGKKTIGGLDLGRAIFLGFPNVIPRRGKREVTNPSTGEVDTGVGRDTDYILRLYEESALFTISYTWSINLYGGIIQSEALTFSSAKTLVESKTYKSDTDVYLIGKYSSTETASSEEEWGQGTSGDGAAAARVRRRSIRGAKNQGIGNYAIHGVGDEFAPPGPGVVIIRDKDDVPAWFKQAWYIYEIEFSISVTYGTQGQEISISDTEVGFAQGTSNIRYKKNLNWAAAGLTVEDLQGIGLEGLA